MFLFFLGWQALPAALIRGLEDKYAPPSTKLSGYAGMVVLGGAFKLPDGRRHDLPALGRAGDRVVAPLPIVSHYRHMRIVFTGGDGSVLNAGEAESEVAKVFFANMGLDMSRVLFESRSRNTFENATLGRDLPGIDIRQPWLLVTSASHMPRALATFQKAGWNVAPYPVDYYSAHKTRWLSYSLMQGIEAWEIVLHEYVGRVAPHVRIDVASIETQWEAQMKEASERVAPWRKGLGVAQTFLVRLFVASGLSFR